MVYSLGTEKGMWPLMWFIKCTCLTCSIRSSKLGRRGGCSKSGRRKTCSLTPVVGMGTAKQVGVRLAPWKALDAKRPLNEAIN